MEIMRALNFRFANTVTVELQKREAMRGALLYKQLTSLAGAKKTFAKPPHEPHFSSMKTTPVRTFSDGILIDQPWGKLTWLASRELGNSNTMTFGRVTIPADQTNPRHRHPNCDEILHLLCGRLEHRLGDDLFLLNPGDTISIPAGQWHNARALDGMDAEMVICFSSADRETEFEP